MDKFDIPYTEETLFMTGKAVAYLVEFMNKSEPFDGFCGFSQGAGTIRFFYTVLQYFQKHFDLKVPMPKFCILFSCP